MASLIAANRCKYIAILIYGPTKEKVSWVKGSTHLEDALCCLVKFLYKETKFSAAFTFHFNCNQNKVRSSCFLTKNEQKQTPAASSYLQIKSIQQ